MCNDIRGTSKSSWGTGHVRTGNKLITELNKEMTGSNMRRAKKVLKKDSLPHLGTFSGKGEGSLFFEGSVD